MNRATLRSTLKKAVRDRVLSGKCLIKGCECLAATRGLCPKHYVAYLRAAQSRPGDARAEFEAACMRLGKILGPQVKHHLTSPNPFANM